MASILQTANNIINTIPPTNIAIYAVIYFPTILEIYTYRIRAACIIFYFSTMLLVTK